VTGVVMVTGASGALGRQVVEFLLERLPPDRVAALARRPESLDDLAQRGVSVRGGDYHDPERLEQAFQGVDKLLLVSAMAFTDAQAAHRNVIGAARAAGVRHIHYTAIQRRRGSSFTIAQVTDWDADAEKELAASGLAATVLRNTMYLDSVDDLIGGLGPERVIRVPAGHTLAALATRRDIAAATAAVLATDGHEGRTYTLAGTSAVSLDHIAAALGEVTGAPRASSPRPATSSR
jgi:NAD(P)H dehydrogenase (quinone)